MDKSAIRTRVTRLLLGSSVKLLRDLVVLLSSHVVSKIVAFVTFVYLARVLEPTGFGSLGFAVALASFTALVVDFGLGSTAVRMAVRQPGEIGMLARLVPGMRLAIAVLSVPVVIAVTHFTIDDPGARQLAVFYGLSVLLLAWNQEWLLQTQGQMGLVALGQIMRIGVFAGLCFLLVQGPDALVWVGVIECVSVAVWIGFLLVASRRAVGNQGRWPTRQESREMIRAAAPLGGNSIVWGFCQQVPQILVALFAGLEQAAWFAASQRLVVSLQSFSYVYHFNLYPALAKHLTASREALVSLASSSVRVIAWITIGPSLIVTFTAPELVTFLFGAPFAAAGPILAIAIWTVPLQFLSGNARWSLIADGRPNAVFHAGLVGLASMLLIGVPLIWAFGAIGAACATVLYSLLIWIVADRSAARAGIGLPLVAAIYKPLLVAAVALPVGLMAHLPLLAGLPIAGIILTSVLYVAIGAILDRGVFDDLRRLATSKSENSVTVGANAKAA